MLRIHAILVWIRIRGSIPLTNGSGSIDPAILDQWPSSTKIRFFLLITVLLKVQLHHFSKIKSHTEVTKQKESMFFLLFFALMTEESGSVSLTNGSGWPKNIGTYISYGFGSGSATLSAGHSKVRWSVRYKVPLIANLRLSDYRCSGPSSFQ